MGHLTCSFQEEGGRAWRNTSNKESSDGSVVRGGSESSIFSYYFPSNHQPVTNCLAHGFIPPPPQLPFYKVGERLPIISKQGDVVKEIMPAVKCFFFKLKIKSGWHI